MSIRLPLYKVLDYNQTVEQGAGPTSIVGGRALPFTLPQDTDNVVVKYQTSILGGGASVTLQTTDDGGITWYDVARSSIVSNTGGSILGGSGHTNAVFLSVGVFGDTSTGVTASLVAAGSVVAVNTTGGSAAASSLGIQTNSGLPILSQQGRVFIRYGAAITSVINERVTVMSNSQSATA